MHVNLLYPSILVHAIVKMIVDSQLREKIEILVVWKFLSEHITGYVLFVCF